MNNPDTDLTTKLLNKFPEANLFEGYNESEREVALNSIKTFLTLNFYNEKLIAQDEKYLYFRNLTTDSRSWVLMDDAPKKRNIIRFLPFDKIDYNEEVKTFNLCNSGITCVRINEKGMFIEESSLIELPITIKHYDNETIKEISKDLPVEIPYYVHSYLLDILTNEYHLKPDLLIKVAFFEKFYTSSNRIRVDRMKVDYYINQDIQYESNMYDVADINKSNKSNAYIAYIKYMYEQNLYSSNLIRIKKR